MKKKAKYQAEKSIESKIQGKNIELKRLNQHST
jgi:hypothetical protein